MDIKINSETVVVFDLDDTLYNEFAYLKSAFWEIATTLDAETPATTYALMISLFRSRQNAFEVLSQKFDTEVTTLLNQYRNHLPNIHPFLGVFTLFEAIKNAGGKIGMITDGRSVSQRNKITALGIEKFLDHIVISEEIGTEKPDPLNYKAIEDNITGSKYWYIGDNLKKDFIAPKKMGWGTIGIADNGLNMHYQGYEYMHDETRIPEFFIKSIDQLKVVTY